MDRMTVMVADVVDCRVDKSRPIINDEDTLFITVAMQRSLYDEDLQSRLKKGSLWPVFLTSSRTCCEDQEKAWMLSSSLGLNLQDEKFEQLINGLKEFGKKTKLKEVMAENFEKVWKKFFKSTGRGAGASAFNAKRLDEVKTEDNNSDIIKALQLQMQEIMAMNKATMLIHQELGQQMLVKARAGAPNGGGVGPFGVDKSHAAFEVKLPDVPFRPCAGTPSPPQGKKLLAIMKRPLAVGILSQGRWQIQAWRKIL